jgi:hypothetical protein
MLQKEQQEYTRKWMNEKINNSSAVYFNFIFLSLPVSFYSTTNLNHNFVYINLHFMIAKYPDYISLYNCVVLTTSALMRWYSPASNTTGHGTRRPGLDHQQNKHFIFEFISIGLSNLGTQKEYCEVLSYRGLSLSFMYFENDLHATIHVQSVQFTTRK